MMDGPHLLLALCREENGQDLVEYALLIGVICLASIASVKALATKIANNFSSLGSTLTSAM